MCVRQKGVSESISSSSRSTGNNALKIALLAKHYNMAKVCTHTHTHAHTQMTGSRMHLTSQPTSQASPAFTSAFN